MPEEMVASQSCPVFLSPAKLILLYNAAKALASTTDLDKLLSVIVSEVREDVECEGAAVVLYDEERDEFYWRTVQDKDALLSSAKEAIRIPKDLGVVGWVTRTGEPALINDAATDPRIWRVVEDRSGFTTRNMICVPLKTRDKLVGVLYALNKCDGLFTEEDVDILVALSGNVALALENAANYESLARSHQELERLNRVKNKMLHHLSHELKTPLAIIDASMKIMERKLSRAGQDTSGLPLERMNRNLTRLKIIEKQVRHIVEDKDYEEDHALLDLVDRLVDFIEIEQDEEPRLNEALASLRRKIEDHLPSRSQSLEAEGITVQAAFQAAEFGVRRMLAGRELSLEFVPPDPATLEVQPQIMLSVLRGIIRNAVENTPDHGKITVRGEMKDTAYVISVRDYGVGIPESEQPNIFEGFYHTQETELYRSGQPYGFNAGGTGTDLLKIRIFAERFGFKIHVRSTRCSCIPTTNDLCPGDITQCNCCQRIEDCYENGGTEFLVEFPENLVGTYSLGGP
ncbi:MAG: GAF domain-containing protein [Thermodesulfobacteriota bacterium]